MIRDPLKDRQRLKGYLFEVVILELLENNGFRRVNERNDCIRENRYSFVEVRGRGTWHQIDCFCDYDQMIPFMYPIRMLGEVKYYSKRVSKEDIRAFIGVVKDIEENYFVKNSTRRQLNRVSELGVFFSANGFQVEAEKLAFAHNIKTISYENNYAVEKIKQIIDYLEQNFLSTKKCISRDNLRDFVGMVSDVIKYSQSSFLREFRNRFDIPDGVEYVFEDLRVSLRQIRASFIGTTSAGVFVHFIGNEAFPDDFFLNRDERDCRIFYSNVENGAKSYWLEFSDDHEERRFYFSPPKSLREAAFYGGQHVLNEKARIFKTISISTRIHGIKRNLTLRLDNDWLEEARERLIDNQ